MTPPTARETTGKRKGRKRKSAIFVVTVTFSLKPGTEAAFMPLMREQARASLADEPLCHRFDVCTDPDDAHTVFLYEIYEDEAAFEAHLNSPHFARFDAAVAPLTAAKTKRAYILEAL